MRKIVLFIFLLNRILMPASDFYFPAGSLSGGTAHASVGSSDFWAVINNPAATAFTDNMQLGVNYESRFNLDELSVKSIGFILPNSFGVITSSFQHYGYDVYNEMRFSLGFARKFGSNFGASLQFCGLGNRLNPEESVLYTLSFDASLYAELSENFNLGFYVFNLSSSRFKRNESDVTLPVYYRLGMQWSLSERLKVLSEIRAKNGDKPNLCGGARFALVEDFELSLGVGNNPFTISGGVLFRKWGFITGISCGIVQQIGKVWNCSLVYSF